MNSGGKPKLALMIFLLFPNLLLFMKWLWIHLSKDFFFFSSWLTVYYSFISLEMGPAGSLINGLKCSFCQNQTNKTPPISINSFVLVFLKQALFPSEHHWRVTQQYPSVFQQRNFCMQLRRWGQKFVTGSRTGLSCSIAEWGQPGYAGGGERERDSPKEGWANLDSEMCWADQWSKWAKTYEVGSCSQRLGAVLLSYGYFLT